MQGDCVRRLVRLRGEYEGRCMRGESVVPRSCSPVYKTFRKLFLVRCDSMHSIVKMLACLLAHPPDSVPCWVTNSPTLLAYLQTQRVIRPTSSPRLLLLSTTRLQQSQTIHSLRSLFPFPPPFIFPSVKRAIRLRFKLMDLPRVEKKKEKARNGTRAKRERTANGHCSLGVVCSNTRLHFS